LGVKLPGNVRRIKVFVFLFGYLSLLVTWLGDPVVLWKRGAEHDEGRQALRLRLRWNLASGVELEGAAKQQQLLPPCTAGSM
jgi:hypothetical protein